MLNPRDVYLQTCSILGNTPGVDYFSYKHPLEEGRADKRLVTTLKKFVTSKKTDVPGLNKASDIFKDWNNRLFMEGLLTYFSIDDLITIPGMAADTLNAYVTYFFDITDLQDFAGKSLFVNTIHNTAARKWFEQCAIREIEDIKYRISGTTRKDADISLTLKRVFNKMATACETFMTITPSTLQTMSAGMSSEMKNMFDIGLKAGTLAAKIGDVIQKYPDQDKDDFIASWSLEILSDSPDSFDMLQSPDIEADLQVLINEINPIKAAQDTLPSDELSAEDML